MIAVERVKQEYLNTKYFDEKNMKNIEKDLKAFAQKGCVSLAELSTSIPKWNIEVMLSNGMKMTWRTFLNNASMYLFNTWW